MERWLRDLNGLLSKQRQTSTVENDSKNTAHWPIKMLFLSQTHFIFPDLVNIFRVCLKNTNVSAIMISGAPTPLEHIRALLYAMKRGDSCTNLHKWPFEKVSTFVVIS